MYNNIYICQYTHERRTWRRAAATRRFASATSASGRASSNRITSSCASPPSTCNKNILSKTTKTTSDLRQPKLTLGCD